MKPETSAHSRRYSYPVSLAVVIAVLIAATGGFIAWWNYRAGVANVRALSSGLFERVSRQAVASAEAFLERAPPAAAALAEIVSLDHPNREALARRCIAVLRANPGFAWVSYSDAEGSFTGAYRTPGGIRVNRSQIVGGKTQLDEHDLAPDGALVLAKHEGDSKYDPRTRPFYRFAAKARHSVWTPPYVFAGQEVPGITYALPHLERGVLRGVFTIDFDLARLSALVRQMRFSPGGRVVMIAGDRLLAHPTAPVVGTAPGGGEPALVGVGEMADPVARRLAAQSGDRRVLTVEGTRYLARSLPVQVPGGPRWTVIAYAPEADFTAGLGRRVVSSLLISLVAVLLAVLIAWLLARRISTPLMGLAAEMERVGEFRLEETGRRGHSRFREIQMMYTALEKMKGGLRSFASYVPRDLVRAVLASGKDASLAGEVRELTVYFSDLAGFTTIAEARTPDALVRLLGHYFDEMSRIIAEERGTLDKYLGDGIMAFWGAPSALPDSAARACVAAIRSQRRLENIAPDGVTLQARIGIATGEVLVGNIGSTERLNYTVMGDPANLASRLESLNKQYGTRIAIDQVTYEQARDVVVARPLDVVAVKGKTRGVRVYELLGLREEGDEEALAVAADSTEALDAYLERRFEAAAAAWGRVLVRLPGDRAATTLRARSLSFAADPPGLEWDGIDVKKEK